VPSLPTDSFFKSFTYLGVINNQFHLEAWNYLLGIDLVERYLRRLQKRHSIQLLACGLA